MTTLTCFKNNLILGGMLALFVVSCSGRGADITAAGTGVSVDQSIWELSADQHDAGGRFLTGLWSIALNEDTGRFEAEPLRASQFHVNVVQYMQKPPALSIAMVYQNLTTGEFHVDVTLSHPFPNSNLRGFDVRGIVFGPTSTKDSPQLISSKDDPSLKWLGPNGLRLKNADGWCRWWNPAEFGTPGLFGYTEGAFGTKGFLTQATLNPYKYFANVLGATDPVVPKVNSSNRGTFATDAGPCTRRYELVFPILGNGSPDARFQYAVDANWAQPSGGGSVPPVSAYPPEANCAEAFHIAADISESTAYYVDGNNRGGDLVLKLEVFDWGAPGNPEGIDGEISAIKIESPTLFEGTVSVPVNSAPGSTNLSGIYDVSVECTPTGADTEQVLVTVVSSVGSYQPPSTGPAYPSGKPLASYLILDVPIKKKNPQTGWARTWGGPDYDTVYKVAFDPWGNACVAGEFKGTVDFDPGAGEDIHTSNGQQDVFLSKFGPYGNFRWALTWGGTGADRAHDIAVDGAGNIYVTGLFSSTTDFDPSPSGQDIHECNGFFDAYLSKFDRFGNFKWARTWGGELWEKGQGVALDPFGSVYVTGTFDGTVDFDPGAGVSIGTSNGDLDMFLSKFDSSGNFLWVRTWGGSGWEEALGAAADQAGNALVTGYFLMTVDFDPGPADYLRTSNGAEDVFLSKFSPSGNLVWARTWGGISTDVGRRISADASGNIHVVGSFWETVDFDPLDGYAYRTSNGNEDAYLVKLSSSGSFLWVNTWGGSYNDGCDDVAVGGLDSIYVAGSFFGTVDFDPSAGVCERTSNGQSDASLSKFDSSGNFIWVRTWGGTWVDNGTTVAADSFSNSYVGGPFSYTVDFDPSPEFDYHVSNGYTDAYLVRFTPDGGW